MVAASMRLRLFGTILVVSCLLAGRHVRSAEPPLGDPNQPYDQLSMEIETPHVAWAKPSITGELRALVIAPCWHFRDTVELAQRLSVTVTPLMVSGNRSWYGVGESMADRDDTLDDVVDAESTDGVFQDLPSPVAYFHIKGCDNAGNWGPVSHYRFQVDATAPVVATVYPGDGVRSASQTIHATVRDEGSAVDPATLRILVAGREYGPDSKGVHYAPSAGRIKWDWLEGRPAGQERVPDGSQTEVRVAAQDFAGHKAQERKWRWTMDYSKDRKPPTVPEVRLPDLPVHYSEDFQQGKGGWRNRTGDRQGAITTRLLRSRRTGDYCLKLHAAVEAPKFEAVAGAKVYHLERFPVISFDYLIPAKTLVNLMLQVNGTMYEIRLSGRQNTHTLLGKAPGVRADGRWRHATIDVLGLARKALPNTRRFRVTAVIVGYPARRGNKRGAYWFLDNFMITGYGVPQAKFTWKSCDITGITGYSLKFDREQWSTPAEKVNATENSGTYVAKEPGEHFLHVRACDGNGNWSGTRHFGYYVKAVPKPAATAKK